MAVCDPLQPAVPGRELSADPTPAEAAATGAATEKLERRIGHSFADPDLLAEALTHPSVLPPRRHGRSTRRARHAGMPRNYERLEFLGDRVLGLVVADLLWRQYAAEPEGDLTRRLAQLVRRDTLAEIAAAMDLDRYVQLSPSESAAGAARKPGILADACEALIAAIYLDGGFAAALAFVERFWTPLIAAMQAPPRDPKTLLQEWAQGRGLGVVILVVPLYLKLKLHLSNATVAELYLVLLVGSVVGPLVAGPLSDQIGRRTTLLIAYPLSALTTLAVLLAPSAGPWLAVALGAMGLVVYLESPLLQAFLADEAPAAERDAIFSLYFAVAFGIGALWAAAVGAALGRLGFGTVFTIMAVTYILAGRLLAKKRKRPAGLQHTLLDLRKRIEALLSCGRFQLRHGNQLAFQISHAYLAALDQSVSSAFDQLLKLAMVV